MSGRVKFGIEKLDQMLGGGLLPGTLTVVYGATGIGKTHLGLTFAVNGEHCEGARGLIFDMTARGDSQRHDEYARRLYDWELEKWDHSIRPG
ncbi:MAG: ATPase domain-containing protein, partial [candidate division NC10 bacterium]